MGGDRILLIDDDDRLRQTVRLVLTRGGYEVIEATGGDAAIRLIEKDQNWTKVVTILCDLQMPGGDGTKVIEYFRAHHPSIPLLILTGASDEVLTEVLLKQGAFEYLTKPVPTTKILEAVRRASRLCTLRRTQG
jgi:DNA-binding NtrC family response regulator